MLLEVQLPADIVNAECVAFVDLPEMRRTTISSIREDYGSESQATSTETEPNRKPLLSNTLLDGFAFGALGGPNTITQKKTASPNDVIVKKVSRQSRSCVIT